MEKIFFKPNRTSFFVMRMYFLFIFLFVLFIFPIIWFQIALNFSEFRENLHSEFLQFFSIAKYFSIWIFALTFWFYYFWINIKYKKEEYIFDKNKIIYNYWNLFSDNSVELIVDKITEVKMILPFFENLIFKTWHILVKNAWTSDSKTIFSNLSNPQEVYENIQILMRENGFHLQKDKLVQEAKPHTLGVLFEIGWRISWIFVFLFYMFLNWFFNGKKENLDFENIYSEINFTYLVITWWIIIILALIPIILNYLDLKRRKYEIFTDSIFYTNWFLTKIYSFLPMEKVSDVDNSQNFFSKIFWLHDIIISSEWTGNQVIFLNMTDGETLIKNIKYLKNSISLTEEDIKENIEKKEKIVWFIDKTDFSIDYDKDFQAKYFINIPRNIFSSFFYWFLIAIAIFWFTWEIIFILPILWLSIIVWLIKWIIEAKFTSFILDKNTVEKKYEFLTNSHLTFTIDKITWVTFEENILDKIFKTCTVLFYSIGWNEPIIFNNIKKIENLENKILSKVWIQKNEDFENVRINFNFKNFILKNIFLFIIFFICIIWIFFVERFINISNFKSYYQYLNLNYFGQDNNFIFIFFIIILVLFLNLIIKFIYWKIAYSSKFYNHRIFKKFYEAESWIVFQKKVYSLFKNIKWVNSIKYPFSNDGNIFIDIAWDVVISWKNWQKFSIWWRKIFWEYLENIYELQDKIDAILNRKDLNKEVLEKSKQSILNSVVLQLLIFILFLIWFISVSILKNLNLLNFKTIIWFFLFFIFIFTWISIWYIKSKFYEIQKDRILVWAGIFYKSRKTILLDRVNFVEKNQGFWWKIFKNWIIKIYTVWSSFVDLILSDSNDYKKLYDRLKKD